MPLHLGKHASRQPKIDTVEAFAEPVADRNQQPLGIVIAGLSRPELSKAGRRPYFPGQGILPARPVKRPGEQLLGDGRAAAIREQGDLAPDPENFGQAPMLGIEPHMLRREHGAEVGPGRSRTWP